MIATQIITDKSILSLNYDSENNLLYGDNQFYVTLQNIGDEPIDNLEVILNIEEPFELLPDNFTASLDEPQMVAVRYIGETPLEDGVYNFNISITNQYAQEKNVNANILSSNKNTQTNNIYQLKYFIERENYKCRIYQFVSPSTTLIPIEINGRCDLSYQEKKDVNDPISAATLKMKLDASLDLTLEDLYSEDERTYKVEVERMGNIIFSGFILPDGIWSDFVKDKWQLDITAVCGLSTLKNYSFSQENGNLFNGRLTAMEIINNCLKKTGLSLPTYVNCQIMYNGWAGYTILSSVYMSTERYFQNQDEPMDCDAVLRSIMNIFGTTIVQFNNSWYIYRSRDMVNLNALSGDTQNLLFSLYYGSTYQQNILLNFGDRLGSHINGALKFHANANQKITISPSIQAFKIRYEYGISYSFFNNAELRFEGSGLNIPGWTVNNPDGLVYRDASGHGLKSVTKYFNNNAPALLTLNQSINVVSGSALKLRIEFSNESKYKQPNSDSSKGLTFSIGIGGQWLKADGTWSTNQERIYISNSTQVSEPTFNGFLGKGLATYEADITSPIDGQLELIIWRDKHEIGNGFFYVYNVSVTGSNQSEIKAKEYLAKRLFKTSTQVKNGITVNNGDSITDLFVGTIFKSDADTPTQFWNRYYIDTNLALVPYPESKELLEIIAAETLSMNPRPMTVFEGDFKGYIDYVNFFSIDTFEKPFEYNPNLNIKKQFQFLKWSYSFDDDITKMVAKEVQESNLDSSVYQVDIYENFGNETKVVIR